MLNSSYGAWALDIFSFCLYFGQFITRNVIYKFRGQTDISSSRKIADQLVVVDDNLVDFFGKFTLQETMINYEIIEHTILK